MSVSGGSHPFAFAYAGFQLDSVDAFGCEWTTSVADGWFSAAPVRGGGGTPGLVRTVSGRRRRCVALASCGWRAGSAPLAAWGCSSWRCAGSLRCRSSVS